jgi:hypothetical protein
MSYLIARPVDVSLEFGRAEEGRLMGIGFPRGLHISSGGERAMYYAIYIFACPYWVYLR